MYNNVARKLRAKFSVNRVHVDVHVSIRVKIIILSSFRPSTQIVYTIKSYDGNTIINNVYIILCYRDGNTVQVYTTIKFLFYLQYKSICAYVIKRHAVVRGYRDTAHVWWTTVAFTRLFGNVFWFQNVFATPCLSSFRWTFVWNNFHVFRSLHDV